MPSLTADALTRALERGSRGGVYFLHGEEEHLKEEMIASIVAAHLDPATRDFNFDQLHGGGVEPEILASTLQTPPMMAEWRVVVVRAAHELAASARTRDVIDSLLDRPVPGLAVILAAQIPSGSKAKFYTRLNRAAHAVEFAALPTGDLPGWLMARAESAGVVLEPAAARALAAAAGPGLGRLITELDKLVSYVGERRRIVAADVAAVVKHVPKQNRWEWFDMVGDKRFGEARRALPVLLEAGETGVGLVIGLGTQFLRLGMAQEGERALSAELPPHQRWLARRIAAQAKKWSSAGVDAALSELLRADRLLKSAPVGDDLVMDELLLRLQVADRPVPAGAR